MSIGIMEFFSSYWKEILISVMFLIAITGFYFESKRIDILLKVKIESLGITIANIRDITVKYVSDYKETMAELIALQKHDKENIFNEYANIKVEELTYRKECIFNDLKLINKNLFAIFNEIKYENENLVNYVIAMVADFYNILQHAILNGNLVSNKIPFKFDDNDDRHVIILRDKMFKTMNNIIENKYESIKIEIPEEELKNEGLEKYISDKVYRNYIMEPKLFENDKVKVEFKDENDKVFYIIENTRENVIFALKKVILFIGSEE